MKKMKPTNARSFLTVHAHSGTCPLIRVTFFPCIACLILTLLLLSAPVLAETFVSGEVSGVWDVEGSPYLVTDTLIVPEGETLLIKPGVMVEFQDQTDSTRTPFYVLGTLEANGEEGDSIYFVSEGSASFGGFISSDDDEEMTLRMKYCVVDSVFGLTNLNNPYSVVLKHSRIVLSEHMIMGHITSIDTMEYCEIQGTIINYAIVQMFYGGPYSFHHNNGYIGMVLDGSCSVIEYNNIHRIEIYGGNMEVRYNTFNNVRFNEGILYFNNNNVSHLVRIDDGEGTLYQNQIGAFSGFGCDITLMDNIIIAGSSPALSLDTAYNGNIENNLLVTNSGLFAIQTNSSSNLIFRNNTIIFPNIGLLIPSDTFVENNIIYGDGGECTALWMQDGIADVHYNLISNVSQYSHNNMELDSTQMYLNPLFCGGDPFDYHLQANSPCIDAGDPDSPDDPDGTHADIGCYYYDQSIDNPPVQTIPEDIFAQTGQLLRIEITATDDNGPFDFTFPDLPDWLTEEDELDWVSDTIAVSGTVSEDAEDFNFTVIVEDGEGQTDSSVVFVNVDHRTLLRGEISGILHVEDSPFYVVENISVPEGDSLVIEPGCELQFRYVEDEEQLIGFDVHGQLIAEGTETDSIIFESANNQPNNYGKWIGITIVASQDTVRFRHSKLELASTAILLQDTSQVIVSNCLFYNNHSGIVLWDCSFADVDSSSFVYLGNESFDGIVGRSSTVYINSCQFVGLDIEDHIENMDFRNSAVYVNNSIFFEGWSDLLYNCYAEVDNCIFRYIVGSLVYTGLSTGYIKNSLFYNQREEYSMGLCVDYNPIIIENNIFHGFEMGVRLRLYYDQEHLPSMQNNLFINNRAAISYDNRACPELLMNSAQYNCFYQNDTLIVNGELDSTNLFVDPLLADTLDYFLFANSPLIDAGNPDSAYYDVDGTRNDIGRWGGPYGVSYEYPLWVKEEPEGIPQTFELFAPYPNPFNSMVTVHYSLPQVTDVQLRLCNILGQRVREERWSSQQAGYHQRVVDASGLASGVYFIELKAGDQVRRVKTVLIK